MITKEKLDRMKRDLQRAEHKFAMQDPEYRRMFEKYGDPVTIGETIARQIIAKRKQGAEDGRS